MRRLLCSGHKSLACDLSCWAGTKLSSEVHKFELRSCMASELHLPADVTFPSFLLGWRPIHACNPLRPLGPPWRVPQQEIVPSFRF